MKTRRRPARPRKPHRPKREITRAAARHYAARYVLARMFKGAKVADGSKVSLNFYPVANWKSAEVWIVYKNSSDLTALKSSDVLVVSKRTGRVLYEGSAGDEG